MHALSNDVINLLTNLSLDSELAKARQKRFDATESTQAAFDTIFLDTASNLPSHVKYYLAAEVAKQTGSEVLANFYLAQLQKNFEIEVTSVLESAINYLRLQTNHPKKTDYQLIQSLKEHGWITEDIIFLAQLIAFVTYQSRLIEGINLVNQDSELLPNQATTAGVWNTKAATHHGRAAPTQFTRDNLGWEPWLNARDPQTLSSEESQTMKKFGQLNSEYFLLLAHHSKILELRTKIDRGVFYTSDGLPRWEREFAATVVSKVNGCIYCASVHARKASQYAKERISDINTLLATTPGDVLAKNFDTRLNAITDFTASLSATPIQATSGQLQQLRKLGLSDLELLDLIQASAFFSWANRLMLPLGEPFELSTTKA